MSLRGKKPTELLRSQQRWSISRSRSNASEDGSNEKPSALQGRSTRSRFDQEVELCEIYRVRAMKRAFEELVRGQVWCYCRALEALAPAVHALGEVDLEMARECLREDMARWAA